MSIPDEAVKLMESQSNSALVLTLIFLISILIVMGRIVFNRLEKILDNTIKTLDQVVRVQERHSAILENHERMHKDHTAEIKDIQKKRR